MENNKKYWKGVEELTNDPSFVKNAGKEFPDYLPVNKNKESALDGEDYLTHRRDFLKMMGFGVAAASLASCEAPVRKAIPYLNKPVDVDPGVPNYYASTYQMSGDYCSIVVKTREGRPIKIEGNRMDPLTMGGTMPQVQASVLSLYDKARLMGPAIKGKMADWKQLDNEVTAKLRGASNVRIISNTIISPTTKAAINDFKVRFGSTAHVTYDPISMSAMLQANREFFGSYALPMIDFSKADTIVSVGADFLGTWGMPVAYARQFGKTRKLNDGRKQMSRLYSFETNLSITGANADHRSAIRPSQEGAVVAALYNEIAGGGVSAGKLENVNYIKEAAADLKASRGRSIVVSGSNDPAVQTLVYHINEALGNFETTFKGNRPVFVRQGNDATMAQTVKDIKSGTVDAVIFYNCNPVYDHPMGAELAQAIVKMPLSVAFNDRMDETSSLCGYVAPDHHYLESWNDAEPVRGHYSLTQPTITPIFKTRHAQESLLTWAGKEKDYYTYLQENWKKNMVGGEFQKSWDMALHDGVMKASGSAMSIHETGQPAYRGGDMRRNLSGIGSSISAAKAGGMELKLYENINIGNGSQANNPWLQENPDPISKACWDNYVSISLADAKEMGVDQGGHVTVSADGRGDITLPALIQPGQARKTVSIALGYGRDKAGRVANGVGKNAYHLVALVNESAMYGATDVSVTKAEGFTPIAQTQTHHTIMGRAIVQESTLDKYKENPAAGRVFPHVATAEGAVKPNAVSLWYEHDMVNHKWGMAIDLNSCIGCSACTIACQAENNVPVVGKAEVINRREMHWLRIDRYYSSDADADDLQGLEIASDNPDVAFQPMMCQHCNHAPCETVCPVLATTHSSEGLNQMTYNRCIGTRYCANNCPYKVRRFNWFKYANNKEFAGVNTSQNNDLGKMVLNPDVTVRSRGVMEKCSLCVQRIQGGKLIAKLEKRRPVDSDITTACAQACPTEAIVFGDYNNEDSQLVKMLGINKKPTENLVEMKEPRAYHVLEELNVQPNVAYLTKIRNKKA